MSVGDSAEEFILIYDLGRERLLVLSGGLPSTPLNILCIPRWEAIARFCLSFLHTSRQIWFQQKPDGRPPHITDRRVSTVHKGRVEAPNDLATFGFHDAVVDFVYRNVWTTRNHATSNPRSA